MESPTSQNRRRPDVPGVAVAGSGYVAWKIRQVTGTPVKTFAEQKGLSASNAGVRVFRAREALKKRVSESCGTCAEHGCLNCTCKPG